MFLPRYAIDPMSLLIVYLLALLIILVLGVAGTVKTLRWPHRFTYANALSTNTPTTPEEAGFEGAAVTFDFEDGYTTPGFIVRGDNPDGPCLFSIHGFGSSRYRNFIWLEPFRPFVSSMVFYDQRGQGESTAPSSHSSVAEASDLLHIVTQLTPEQLQNGLVFYGRSMGGATVLHAGAGWQDYAMEQKPKLHGVIAEGPYARWHQPVYNVFHRRKYPTWPFIPLVGLLFRLINPKMATFDRHDDAAKLACPLLVIHGDADDTCDFEIGQSLAEAAEDGTLVRIPDGTHVGLAQHDPQRYRDALADFFGKLQQQGLPS